ncbi:MAG: PilZ domain-containing protein [Myxococcales bacterium]|nr:PilZ domain-containing protein [Myxococcales bacterium]MCB9628668.1 PilZ domain-containing protein [Sandaracinaceae bacterium]
MQPQIERRSHAQRVPMDQGIVEVSFVEYGETAPADAVNIAEGGLSLRASILPEVGTEMRCAFPMPDGQSIEADCEVVWAQHSGPYAGEFGLRFVDIARLDEERIRDYVDAHRAREGWDDSDPGDSDGGYVDDSDPGYAARVADAYSPHEAPPEAPKRSAIPDTIRLHIDGVASPVAASVVQATHDALVVEQVLPFLCLGTGIAAIEDGPKGKLASVELRVVDGAPRLVLTVLFGDEASLPGDEPVAVAEARVHSDAAFAKTELRSPLDTLPDMDDADALVADVGDEQEAPESLRVGMALEDARHSSVPPARIVDARPSHAPRAASVPDALDAADELSADELDELDELLDGASYVRHETPRASSAESAVEGPVGDSPVDRLSFMLRTRTRQLSERAAPVTSRARALAAGGVRGLLPALRALWAQLMVLAGALRAKAMPALKTLGRRASATVTQLRTGQAPRTTRSGRPVRRQQSRLGATVRPGATHAPQAPQSEPRPQRRTAVLSVVAFALVATTVWALSSDDELSAPTESTTAPSTTSNTPPPPSAAVSPYVAPTPAAPVEPVAVAPAEPAAPAGPTPGPLAEPTYPTLGEERPQEPGTVPSDSPYAEEAAASAPVQEGRTFGAESVNNGRSFEITMSVPVRTLRGRAEGNGFVVDIPDALAISGARTISRNHPMVARSHILNHGDHSTLTVEFVAGQSPAYRVSARGAALQIEIAR